MPPRQLSRASVFFALDGASVVREVCAMTVKILADVPQFVSESLASDLEGNELRMPLQCAAHAMLELGTQAPKHIVCAAKASA